MSSKNNITQDKLKSLIEYNQETGIFKWKVKISYLVSPGDIAGTTNRSGYIVIKISGKGYKAHRLAWLYVHGRWPKEHLDHINHKRDDNRICNLREVSAIENSRNISPSTKNKSGVRGVFLLHNGKYLVKFMRLGKSIHVGRFDTLEEAVEARRKALVDNGFHENHGEEV